MPLREKRRLNHRSDSAPDCVRICVVIDIRPRHETSHKDSTAGEGAGVGAREINSAIRPTPELYLGATSLAAFVCPASPLSCFYREMLPSPALLLASCRLFKMTNADSENYWMPFR